VTESAAVGFGLEARLPESWREHFIMVWGFFKIGAPLPGIVAAPCFARTARDGAAVDLPAMFAPDLHDGIAPGQEQLGYVSWLMPFGANAEARAAALSGYVPQPGDRFGLMLTSPNRKERSNVVAFELPTDDVGEWTFDETGAVVPPAGLAEQPALDSRALGDEDLKRSAVHERPASRRAPRKSRTKRTPAARRTSGRGTRK
jgi:hypothetical protein